MDVNYIVEWGREGGASLTLTAAVKYHIQVIPSLILKPTGTDKEIVGQGILQASAGHKMMTVFKHVDISQ